MTVFVDTSAICALLDRADEGHPRAMRGQAVIAGEELVTHEYVVIETVSIVHRRLGSGAAARLIDDFLPALTVVDVGEQLRNRALASFRAGVSTDVSLVDRTSFEVMRDHAISRAFALDDAFEHAGFVLVS